MRRKAKIFIIYFPVILVACQVIANWLYFINESWYEQSGFYLNHFFGTNVLFAIFLVLFTFMFRFCAVSRVAALAELLFALYYLVVQRDDIYNIIIQITAGSAALLFTAVYYIRKFPLCKLSLVVSFITSLFYTGSCEDAFRHWDGKIESKVDHQLFQNRSQ